MIKILNSKKANRVKAHYLLFSSLLMFAATVFAEQINNEDEENLAFTQPETIASAPTQKEAENSDTTNIASFIELKSTPQNLSACIDKNSKQETRGDKVATAANTAVATNTSSVGKVEGSKDVEINTEEIVVNKKLDESKNVANSVKPKEKSQANKHIKTVPKNTIHKKNTSTSSDSLKEIFFADNEQINVILSNRDINRLLVKGDKIQTINGPAGLYVAKNDPSGAAYISVYGNTTFTIFISTVKGHSCSVLITPKTSSGKNVVLAPTTPFLDETSVENDYQKTLISLISNMINNEVPEDYGHQVIKRFKTTDFYGVARIKPVAVYSGDSFLGVISTVKNSTNNDVILKPSYFYHSGIKALALSEPLLSPKSTVLLYQVITRSTEG